MKFPLFQSLWRVNSPSFPRTQHTASSDWSFFFHFFIFLCISVWCRSSQARLRLLSIRTHHSPLSLYVLLLWLSIRKKKNVLHVLFRLFLSSLVFSPNIYEMCTSTPVSITVCVCVCAVANTSIFVLYLSLPVFPHHP